MISLANIIAVRKGSRVGPLTFTLAPGVHALLADGTDGADALLRVLARRCSFQGELTCADNVAAVLSDLALPEELTCAEYIDLASELRLVKCNAAAVLDRYGLSEWAGTRLAQLPKAERKSLAIGETQTSGCPVQLLEDPLTGVPVTAVLAIERALRERTPTTTVVFSTNLTSVAAENASTTWVLRAGLVQAQLGPADVRLLDERYRIFCDAPGLLHTLLTKAAGSALDIRISGNVLWVSARNTTRVTQDPVDVAKLVTRAAAEGSVNVQAMERETALPEVIRARLAQQMHAAHIEQKIPPQGTP